MATVKFKLASTKILLCNCNGNSLYSNGDKTVQTRCSLSYMSKRVINNQLKFPQTFVERHPPYDEGSSKSHKPGRSVMHLPLHS